MALTDYKVAKIKKRQPDGMIELLNASDVPLSTLSENSQIRRYGYNDALLIIDNVSGKQTIVWVQFLISYQLEPAAPVLFTGTLFDWWALLGTSFFPIRLAHAHTSEIVDGSSYGGANLTATLNFLLGGGGGGVIQDNITAVAGAYTALPTDYILYATAISTITLPDIVDVGRVYRIFANNNKVDIVADPSDNITGLGTINIKKWESLTLRAINITTWLIGD